MALSHGDKLGPYENVGKGGMGRAMRPRESGKAMISL
jgi:hypothetical protein